MAATAAYYKGPGFDDATGNGNTAIQVGTVPQPSSPTPPEGSVWFAYQPAATPVDYVDYPVTLINGTTQMAIVKYFRWETGKPDAAILSAGDGSGNQRIYIILTSGLMAFQQVDGGGDVFNFAIGINRDQTYLLRIEVTSSNVKCYLDGVLQTTVAGSWVPPTYTYLSTGRGSADAGSFYMDGAGVDGVFFSPDAAATYPPAAAITSSYVNRRRRR